MCCHLDVPIIVISDMFGVVRSPITGNISPSSVINNPLPRVTKTNFSPGKIYWWANH